MGASQQSGVLDLSFKAAADYSTKQYYAMYVSAANTVTIAGANAKVVGVLQNTPDAANETAVVRVCGTTKVVAGEAIAAGKYVTSTSAGKAEVADAAGEHCFGVALEAATADGDIIEILLSQFETYGSDA